jgi:hypothetical protein
MQLPADRAFSRVMARFCVSRGNILRSLATPVRRVVEHFGGIIHLDNTTQYLVLLPLLAAAAAILSLHYPHGISLTPDSALFISAADSLLHGRGLTVDVGEGMGTRLTHHPPLYPLLLAVGKEMTGSFLIAATVLNFASLLGCCLTIYFFMIQQAPVASGVVAVALLVCSGAMYSVHRVLGTDGISILVMLVVVYHLGEFMHRGTSRGLILAGLALAAASLIRYAYLAFIPAACLVVALRRDVKLGKRLRLVGGLGAIALAPTVVAIFCNLLFAGSATNRVVRLHLIDAPKLTDGINYLSAWLLPYRIPFFLRGIALCAVCMLGMILAIRSPQAIAFRISASFLLAYLGFLVISVSLFDVATPLDERILAPAVAILCVQVSLIASWMWARSLRASAATASLLVLSVGVVGITRLAAQVTAAAHEGLGTSMAGLEEDFQDVLPVLRSLPLGTVIYSNVASEIYLVSGKHARNLPMVVGYTDARPRTEVEIAAQVRELAVTAGRSGAFVVYRLRRKTLFDLATIDRDELCRRISLTEVFRSPKFAVYSVKDKPQQSMKDTP